MSCRHLGRRVYVFERKKLEALTFGFRENRRRQRPRWSGDFTFLVSRPRNDKKLSTWSQRGSKRGKRLRQKLRRERLQRVAFVDEIKSSPPCLGQGEEIAGMIGNHRGWKAPLRPIDRRADEIERRDARARRAQTFRVVAKTAADIESAQSHNAPRLPANPGLGQGMGCEIAPGHTGRIVFGEPIDGFEPFKPQRIGRVDTAMPRRIKRIENLAGLGTASGELGGSRIEEGFVQSVVFRNAGP